MLKILVMFCGLAAWCVLGSPLDAKNYELLSPDGHLSVNVSVDEKCISYFLSHGGDLLVADSPVSMTLADGTVLGRGNGKPKVRRTVCDEMIDAVVYRKSAVRDNYSQMTFSFRGFDLVFRAYDSGMAYRFVVKASKPFRVKSEEAVFNFPADWTVFVPYVRDFDENDFAAQYRNSFENLYSHIRLSEWDKRRLAFLPLLVEGPAGKKIAVTEADLQDYPGMYLYNGDGSTCLTGDFAPLPDVVEQGGHNNLQGIVKTRKDYIAEYDVNGKRENVSFPWRVVAVSEKDAELADNDLVYCLAEPQDPSADFSWVRPGKVAWDWWNDWNLYNVDFKAGINNETYKYYIDFASEHGIPYVILDEGWAVNGKADMLDVIPEIDLQMLVDYAGTKNVGIILWAGYWAMNRDLEGLCAHFSEMGVKGFKIDFMDRDDQYMVRFLRDAAATAARYGLIVDFHGTHKPTGLQRTWPNAINYEGVHGLEQMKWVDGTVDQVTYDVTIPFIRMIAGPFDYTQGAMRNASRHNYRPVYNEAMSQGTRCRQLAEYVVFESPFNMLCDSPSNYIREEECTEFIAGVPEVWDETQALDGSVSEYIVVARRKGDEWYVGGMTDWSARDYVLDLSFVKDRDCKVEIFRDGINADRAACDYSHVECGFPEDGRLHIRMASGGGFAVRISPSR